MSEPSRLLDRLRKAFDREAWQQELHDLFPNGTVTLFASPQILSTSQEKVTSTLQLGVINLSDGQTLALLEVETSNQVLLARNRVGLRNFVAGFIDEAGAAAVLAVFHQPGSPDWRLTYASRRTTLDEDTFEITTIETAPRRYTFLLGENEPCRTAASRLAMLLEKEDNLTLSDVEKAFSVESLTKDFFKKYKEHYQAFTGYLLSKGIADATRRTIGIPISKKDQEKADKPVRDFVKTLLGRLVFLYFLQKKGWLGCPAGTTSWTGGDPAFIQSLFAQAQSSGDADRFHSKYLVPLFFDALNNPESNHRPFPLTGNRLPYLNGGLFEVDSSALRSIDFPADLFDALLQFFSEYNFTIDENDPEDHEVGIDPEMLGHIFENLLEDNKDKGAFYTPKAIVSYMARQSLQHYLRTHLGDEPELEILLNEKDHTKHPKGSFVAVNAKHIAKLLDEVKICDPAIGSGAFPIGLLQEILWTRLALNLELNEPAERAKLKRRIIQNSIHGVDIDPGAVEIARLRFWLALVVDEEAPRPLPNLDYKIMQGDALLESFEGIDLSRISTGEQASYALTGIIGGQREFALDDAKTQMELQVTERREKISGMLRDYFPETDPVLKKQRHAEIDAEVLKHLDHAIAWERERIEGLLDQQRKIRGGKIAGTRGWTPAKGDKAIAGYEADLAALRVKSDKLRALQTSPERPFFLWHLYFQEVFEKGGFDIVLANPPYVRHETISDYAPVLREHYEVTASRADLFIFFYEQGVELLRDGGILTFITSNKYYRAAYGSKLRPFLRDKLTLHTLIDFDDAPVFDAIAYASILIGSKGAAEEGHRIRAYNWKPEDSVQRLPQVLEANSFALRQAKLSAEGWQLEPPAVVELLDKLRIKGTPLGDYVGGRFYRGIITGLNDAFVITAEKREELNAEDENSEDLIKPFLRGKDVKRWQVTHHNLYLIVFPHGFHSQLKNYPAILKHLKSFETDLKKRGQCTSSRGDKGEGQHHWLELDNNPKASYLNCFAGKKIVMPAIERRTAFVVDHGHYSNDKTNICVADDCEFLCAVLNSSTTWWVITQTAATKQNGYYEFKPLYIKPIPIPPASAGEKARLVELGEACVVATAKKDPASLVILEREINQIVYRLFDLTPQEIRLIEGEAAHQSTAGTHGHTKDKDALFRRLRAYGQESPYFSIEKIRADLKEENLKFTDELLREYLSEAMQRKLVHDAGRGWYSSLAIPAVLDPEPVADLRATLAKRFPFLPHYVWSTQQVNPWMHHLLGKFIRFVHVERDGADDVAAFLRNEGWIVTVNPTAKTAKDFTPGDRSVVVRGVLRGFDPTVEPRVETVLVDLLLENRRLNLMDEGERQEMSRKLVTTHRVEISNLLSRLGDHKRSLMDLVGLAIPPIIAEK
ncbi:Eco57I restriction-modification methylase domain-containing protein [Luteolibacter sp. GHJ8]|uniref:site-specific DNA-methyltransferase (adenine-specific) n=1 Tax=Luteolibacter rhizosphaerae TaxID=2989719 RepID=A0ABT3G096_9BACT|nr:DUF6577 family protein [Luteolibacter rhizosphaerae]MCW1912650.1 Eco57I restriction-modification methylase domain-containing protein [Luteolibacter rhizosphaerae]